LTEECRPGWEMFMLLTEELNGNDIMPMLEGRPDAPLIRCLVGTLASVMEAGYGSKEAALRVLQNGALEAAGRDL
jgi:hypothetical protein